jgi:hypothetical protein
MFEQLEANVSTGLSTTNDNAGSAPEKWWKSCWNKFGLHFFKKQATENMQAKSMVQLAKMADVDPKDIFSARDAYAKWAQKNLNIAAHFAYNQNRVTEQSESSS